MSNQSRHLLDWFMVIAWMSVIYYFSDQPDLKSALAPTWDHVVRKAAHFLEYLTLCYLLCRAIRRHGVAMLPALLVSVYFASLYAVTDEWHQGWVTGRITSPIDVLIDTLGALTCAILLFRREQSS